LADLTQTPFLVVDHMGARTKPCGIGASPEEVHPASLARSLRPGLQWVPVGGSNAAWRCAALGFEQRRQEELQGTATRSHQPSGWWSLPVIGDTAVRIDHCVQGLTQPSEGAADDHLIRVDIAFTVDLAERCAGSRVRPGVLYALQPLQPLKITILRWQFSALSTATGQPVQSGL